MSVILLIISEVADRSESNSQDSLAKLRLVEANLFSAIGSEQAFLARALEEDQNKVIESGQNGKELITSLKESSVNQEELSKIENEIKAYLDAFGVMSVQVLSGKEGDQEYRIQLNEMDSLVNKMLDSIRDYIGKQKSAAEDADSTVVSLGDVIRNVDLVLTRNYMNLQNRVFLEDDVDGYLLASETDFTEFKNQLRNLRVLSKLLKRKKFDEFSSQGATLYEMVTPMPEIAKNLAVRWQQRISAFGNLNNTRDAILKSITSLIESENSDVASLRIWLKVIQYGTVLILCAVFITFSVKLTKSITGPLKEVTGFAEVIKDGELSKRIDRYSQDELGNLAKSFNEMADGLQQKAEFASAVASGDLSQHVDLASNDDALGIALDKMVDDLNLLLAQVNGAVDQVSGGATQLSDSSQALSTGATEQAASLQEINSSVTELVSQTKTNSVNAQKANELSGEARQAAENGNQKMSQLISAMNDINRSGSEISKIIKAIDEIAFQTNLLALNAAVEAARAGAHGKGFAVVADEVRNLAGRSAKAAHETAELIDASVKNTENGSRIVNETAEALNEIVDRIAKATDLVGEIASASNDQALGLEQINVGLDHVDKVTQQNSANAEETASTAMVFTKQASQLSGLVAQFKLANASNVYVEEQPLITHIESGDQESAFGSAEDTFVFK